MSALRPVGDKSRYHSKCPQVGRGFESSRVLSIIHSWPDGEFSASAQIHCMNCALQVFLELICEQSSYDQIRFRERTYLFRFPGFSALFPHPQLPFWGLPYSVVLNSKSPFIFDLFRYARG